MNSATIHLITMVIDLSITIEVRIYVAPVERDRKSICYCLVLNKTHIAQARYIGLFKLLIVNW